MQHCSSNIKDQLLCSKVCWKYPQLSLSQIPKERCGIYVSQFIMVTPGGYLWRPESWQGGWVLPVEFMAILKYPKAGWLMSQPNQKETNTQQTENQKDKHRKIHLLLFVFQFVFLVVFALFWLLFACFCCFCCPCWSRCLSAHVFILLFVSFCFYWICFCSLDSLSRDWVFLLYLLGILYSSSTVPLTLSFRSFAVRTFWPSTGWGRVQQRRPVGLQMLFGTIQSILPNFESQSHPFGCLAEAHIFKYCFP